MPYTVLIFCSRKDGFTPSQFRDYAENNHMPVFRSLAGDTFPRVHSRRYLDQQSTSTNPDNATGTAGGNEYKPTVLFGAAEFFDYDLIVEHIHDSEDAFNAFFAKVMGDPEVAAKLAEDEAKFMNRDSTKAVVIGEVAENRK